MNITPSRYSVGHVYLTTPAGTRKINVDEEKLALDAPAVEQGVNTPSSEPTSATKPGKCIVGLNNMYKTEEENFSREGRYGMVPLREGECCWTCRHWQMYDLYLTAEELLENVKDELTAFKEFLARENPELAIKPFNFTLDLNAELTIVDSDDISPHEKIMLTQAIRDYKSLSDAIQSHAKTLIKYASYLEPDEGEEPLSIRNFSSRVDYGALLSDTTGTIGLFGKPYNERQQSNRQDPINITI
ncbi:MAG TPA: hypothetical protein VF682_12130 [Pseudomonas sp.]